MKWNRRYPPLNIPSDSSPGQTTKWALYLLNLLSDSSFCRGNQCDSPISPNVSRFLSIRIAHFSASLAMGTIASLNPTKSVPCATACTHVASDPSSCPGRGEDPQRNRTRIPPRKKEGNELTVKNRGRAGGRRTDGRRALLDHRRRRGPFPCFTKRRCCCCYRQKKKKKGA